MGLRHVGAFKVRSPLLGFDGPFANTARGGDRCSQGSASAWSAGSGNRGARVQTSCAVVVAPTLDRAFARWGFSVECERPRRRAVPSPIRPRGTLRPRRPHGPWRGLQSPDRPEYAHSRQPARRREPLLATLDRDLVGCNRAPNTCRRSTSNGSLGAGQHPLPDAQGGTAEDLRPGEPRRAVNALACGTGSNAGATTKPTRVQKGVQDGSIQALVGPQGVRFGDQTRLKPLHVVG